MEGSLSIRFNEATLLNASLTATDSLKVPVYVVKGLSMF